MKCFFEKKNFFELCTSKNSQNFSDFEGVVRFLIPHKNKKLFEKTDILPILTKGAKFCPTHKLYNKANF